MSEGSDAGPADQPEALPEDSSPTGHDEDPGAASDAGPAEAGPSSLGIWAFALALLGLIPLLPVVGSVLGFVLGRVAIRQADSRRLRGGRGLAVAAVTISVITLVVIALAVAGYALAVAYLEI